MKYFLTGLLLILVLIIRAQSTDYADYRTELKSFSCSAHDSAVVYGSYNQLIKFDTSGITKNLHLYYEDLAMAYYLMQGDQCGNCMEKCIDQHHKALYHEPDNGEILYELGFTYILTGQCEKGRYYLGLAKAHTKKKHWDAGQEKQILARCNP